MIRLVNLKHNPTEPYHYIGRENVHRGLTGSKWGNPFPMKNEGERLRVLQEYENHILTTPTLLRALYTLGHSTLGCWCISNDPNITKVCHGHILIKLHRKFVRGLEVPAELGVVDEAILNEALGK